MTVFGEANRKLGPELLNINGRLLTKGAKTSSTQENSALVAQRGKMDGRGGKVENRAKMKIWEYCDV